MEEESLPFTEVRDEVPTKPTHKGNDPFDFCQKKVIFA